MAKQIKNGNLDCTKRIMAVHNALYILSGRCKISILTSLYYRKMRFTELQREIAGISGKVLSTELKELELNGLLT